MGGSERIRDLGLLCRNRCLPFPTYLKRVAYRSHNREPGFLAFLDKRLVVEVYRRRKPPLCRKGRAVLTLPCISVLGRDLLLGLNHSPATFMFSNRLGSSIRHWAHTAPRVFHAPFHSHKFSCTSHYLSGSGAQPYKLGGILCELLEDLIPVFIHPSHVRSKFAHPFLEVNNPRIMC